MSLAVQRKQGEILESCGLFESISIEPYIHYIDAFLRALEYAEVPEEEWP